MFYCLLLQMNATVLVSPRPSSLLLQRPRCKESTSRCYMFCIRHSCLFLAFLFIPGFLCLIVLRTITIRVNIFMFEERSTQHVMGEYLFKKILLYILPSLAEGQVYCIAMISACSHIHYSNGNNNANNDDD